jgi:hypothetical protein
MIYDMIGGLRDFVTASAEALAKVDWGFRDFVIL